MRNIRAVSFIAFVTLFFSLSCWAHDGPPLPEIRDLDTLMSEFELGRERGDRNPEDYR